MVFDEIDAGIGGTTAHGVAETLSRLAGRAQVITITHLPQIASRAERHFRVEKIPGDPTHTRIEELARTSSAKTSWSGCSADASSWPRCGGRPWLVWSSSPGRHDSTGGPSASSIGSAEDDVAIVDHADLDRVTAEELLETGVRVVVNVSESLSGKLSEPRAAAARPRRRDADRRPGLGAVRRCHRG